MLSLIAAAYVGYGVAGQIPAGPVPHSDQGPEVRALWGGEKDDTWSAWLGQQPARYAKDDVAYGSYVKVLPHYTYVAGLRRFNMHLQGPSTFFTGTGFMYRETQTCFEQGSTDRHGRSCIPGDNYVSSKWAFAQEVGYRWRIVEVSVGHFSTGGISTFNHGINLLRFTIYGHMGKKEEGK